MKQQTIGRIVAALLVLALHGTAAAQLVTVRGNELRLRDAVTGNVLSINVPDGAVASSFTLSLPSSPPVGQANLLLTNAAGMMSWLAPGPASTVLTSNGSTLSWQDPSAALGAWLVTGNATASAWNGTTGNFVGTTSAQPLVLATRNASAQPILFFTGANGSMERMRINADGGIQIGTTSGLTNTQVAIGGIAASGGRGIDVNMAGTTTSSGVVIRNIGANGATDAGLLIGTASNGVGTAIRIGSVAGFNDPSVGVEIEASTIGIAALPTTAGSGTGARIGLTGTRFRTGVETYVRALATETAVGYFASASADAAGLGIGVHATTSGLTGSLYPLVVTSANNADVYLGSSASDVPTALSAYLAGTQNANTTRMHNARLSGALTFRGTGTGVTSFQAGAQGTTNISYTLPTAAPTSSNMVLVSTPAGAMSWANPSSMTGILEEATPGQDNIRRRLPYLQLANEGTPGTGSIDLQGARNTTLQTASGTHSGILAGRSNTVAGDYGAIAGGQDNLVSSGSDYSVIGAGTLNEISASDYSIIGAGEQNVIAGVSDYSGIVAGQHNTIDASGLSFIGAGEHNEIANLSYLSAITAGQHNTINNSPTSFVGAGSGNSITSSQNAGVVAGSSNEIDNGYASFIGAGTDNRILTSDRCAIVAGRGNTVNTARNSVVVGGTDNTVSGDYSVILGGRNLVLNGDNSVGFNAGSAMTVAESGVAVFANTNLWLANNSGTPSEIRFYTAQATSGEFPATGTHYIALRAPASGITANITYALPAQPLVDGSFLTSTTTGEMSWIEPSASAFWSTSGNTTTSAWDGTSGSYLGTTPSSTQPLVIATRNATPADIRFYTGVLGSTERLRIDGTTGNVGVGTTGAPTRRLDVNGTVRLGVNGTTITNVIKVTVTHDVASVAANTSATFDLAVSNAATSAVVNVSPSAALPDGLLITWSRVSSTGTVTVGVYNATASAIDPASMDFHVMVIE